MQKAAVLHLLRFALRRRLRLWCWYCLRRMDLHLPVARGGYHSLYIEMKNETGRANDAQNWWLERLKLEGNYTVVCYGWQSAVDVLTWYLGLGEYHA